MTFGAALRYSSGRGPGWPANEVHRSGARQGSASASAVCGFTCFNSVENREAFLFCEDVFSFGGFARAIRWDFDHAWNRAVWFIGFRS